MSYHRSVINKSWNGFAGALLTGGGVFLFLGILFLFATEDLVKYWVGPVILLAIGVVLLVAGIKVKKWAKKNGKK